MAKTGGSNRPVILKVPVEHVMRLDVVEMADEKAFLIIVDSSQFVYCSDKVELQKKLLSLVTKEFREPKPQQTQPQQGKQNGTATATKSR